jgi:hypothetical protein
MRRFAPRLFTLCMVASLVAFVAVGALWLRTRSALSSRQQPTNSPLILSDPEAAGRQVIVAPGLVRRDDPTLSEEARRIIELVDAERVLSRESDVLYRLSQGASDDSSKTARWTVMFYPVSGYSRAGHPLSDAVEVATVFPEFGIVVLGKADAPFAGPVIITAQPLGVASSRPSPASAK